MILRISLCQTHDFVPDTVLYACDFQPFSQSVPLVDLNCTIRKVCALMAPGLKPKRAPQSWAATQRSSKTGKGDEVNPVASRSEEGEEAVMAGAKFGSTKVAAKSTTKPQKKLPPAPDAATEVYSEFLAAKEKNRGLSTASTQGMLAAPRQSTEQQNTTGTATEVNAQGTCRLFLSMPSYLKFHKASHSSQVPNVVGTNTVLTARVLCHYNSARVLCHCNSAQHKCSEFLYRN